MTATPAPPAGQRSRLRALDPLYVFTVGLALAILAKAFLLPD